MNPGVAPPTSHQRLHFFLTGSCYAQAFPGVPGHLLLSEKCLSLSNYPEQGLLERPVSVILPASISPLP